MKRFLAISAACLAVVSCLCAPASAQDKAALSQILKSDEAAAKLVGDLRAYASKSPWDIEVTSIVAQRLAVKGLKPSGIMRTIITSGDMAAALDVDDQKFAQIAWLTGILLASGDNLGPSLYGLESLGVPVFDLLGEMVGRPPDEVLQLLRQGRLAKIGTFDALTESYDRKYHGMAEKLAAKRAGK